MFVPYRTISVSVTCGDENVHCTVGPNVSANSGEVTFQDVDDTCTEVVCMPLTRTETDVNDMWYVVTFIHAYCPSFRIVPGADGVRTDENEYV